MENRYNYHQLARSLSNSCIQLKEQVKELFKVNNGDSYHVKDIETEFYNQKEIFEMGSLLFSSDLNGNITYINDKFCQVSQYNRNELLGQHHSKLGHSDTPISVFQDIWKTIGIGKVWQGEIMNMTKDGSQYWVHSTYSPVIDECGEPIEFISMHHEIAHQILA